MNRRRRLLGVEIDDIGMPEAVAEAKKFLDSHQFHQVVTPGPEFLLEATANAKFHNILNRADLSLPDGMGLKVAGWLSGQKVRQRVTGVDFVIKLLELCQQMGRSVFLYGGQAGVAEQAVRRIMKTYPRLLVAGFESGYRGPWQQLHERRVLEKIHLAKPSVLLVALGAPKQELWIDRHRQGLHDVRIAIGVGRTFDYLAGITPRAPKLLRQLGLEWTLTYVTAGKYYQPEFRRQRVRNATWHFLRQIIKQRHV